ncbi:MAG: hypothetical protein KBS52_04585, partial [Clostridiales bacterium]|nr:hypothetical protein [Candidatus Equinaster intestinalis]
LTPEQRADANAVISFKKMMIKQSHFLEESPLFKISAGRADFTTINYVVSGTDAAIKANSFAISLKDTALFEKIKTGLGSDLPAEYFSDLIFFDVISEETETANVSALLKVSVYATSPDESKKMAKTVGEFIAEKLSKSADKSYTLTKASESTAIGIADSIRNNQQNAVNLYNSFRGAVKDSAALLDDDAKAYYEAAIAEENETETQDETEQVKDTAKPSISKKYAALGLLLGAALAVCFYIFKYLFTRKIKSADDIKCRYDLFVIGQAETVTGKKKNALDKFIIRIIAGKPDETQNEKAIKNALLAANNAEAKEVVFIREKSEGENPVITDIEKTFKENGITAQAALPPASDAKSTEKFAAAKFAILFKTAGVSGYDGIYREIDLAAKYDTKILGIVVLK